MSDRLISSDLLNITVGIRREAGVTTSQVRALIEQFVDQPGSSAEAGGIVGFLWLDDIPAHRRGDFLSALSSLTPTERPEDREPPRILSANHIWPSRISG